MIGLVKLLFVIVETILAVALFNSARNSFKECIPCAIFDVFIGVVCSIIGMLIFTNFIVIDVLKIPLPL